MKVFVDTNVILENFLRREDYANGASVKAMTPAEFLESLSEKK